MDDTSQENGHDVGKKRNKKKSKKGTSPFPEVDKETFEYFQRVKEGFETQEFEDEEEKSKELFRRHRAG